MRTNNINSFENIVLAKGDRALCQEHQEDLSLVYLNKGLFGTYNGRTGCSKCVAPQCWNRSFDATFQASSANQCCAISPHLSRVPPETAQTVKNPVLDFENHVVEHELWDMNSNGYGLKSLVYMKDQKVLAACSLSGSISFWSIGEKVEPKELRLNLEKKVNFAKYCMISDSKKYLVIGTDKGVHVYHMTGDTSSLKLLGVIDQEKTVSDLDFLESEGKIVTGYNESIAKVWSLDNLAMEKVVDLHQYGIKGEIHTVMYLNRTGELAIEHASGLSVIKDWQQKDGHVRNYLVANKDSFGCNYLPKTRRFIINNGRQDVRILNEEDFAEVTKYITSWSFHGVKGDLSKKFLSSQDEDQIVSNRAFSYLALYTPSGFKELYLNHYISEVSEVEMIEDQYRIAKASSNSGIVTIYRVNANTNIERGEDCSILPAVASNEKILGARYVGGRSLFSGIASSRGGLFSGGNSASRKISSRSKNVGISSSKKPTKTKPKQVSKPAKKGKKIQKVQVRSHATKKKEKVAPLLVKKEKTTKTKSLKKPNKDMIEAVRIKGNKKTKEEKVWVVLASDDDDEKKRDRRLEKISKTEENQSNKKGKRKADLSKDKGSRSRSKSKSVTRKK